MSGRMNWNKPRQGMPSLNASFCRGRTFQRTLSDREAEIVGRHKTRLLTDPVYAREHRLRKSIKSSLAHVRKKPVTKVKLKFLEPSETDESRDR
jgi:hypothetical protein